MFRSLPPVALVAAAVFPLHAAELNLPDVLTTSAGAKVTTADDWMTKRRPEILELFRTHVYGRAPIGRPDSLKFEATDIDEKAMDGAATKKLVTISYQGPGGKGAIHLVLFTPNKLTTPAPCMLLICNRPPKNIDPTRAEKSPFWPAEQMIERGYAAAAFYNADVDPDKDDGFKDGVHGIFDDPAGRKPDSWATIAAWAWGASRVMDYLETDPAIDGKRVAVIGHSRGGKTALWAGAEDQRFAMVGSNCSGCTGASLARRRQPKAESVARINKAFPHWFCENYKQYSDNEDALPVDQHMLAALTAPRLLYIVSASEDLWADPEGEFLSGKYASPVWQLFGKPGLVATAFPAPDSPLQEGNLGYHLRSGKHDLTEYDWARYMDFADRHLKAR